ncbi:hypothetical protein NVS47_16565 [Dehalobacterium formicoaceticum]|uniref:Uncharacterized protein n=1 Tax=Dehalobacterium formicoaceticum TaxID=51515 RepID=A0ABT1Y893_9FIRM|nr:hypothetical protein [Dehalobacterium formicoaceticum]MCR6547102.1 hypothetical protein [Dehalobacterium formicoaceticum]
MKNHQKKTEQTLQIPLVIQQRCGFTDAETLAVMAADGVCVIHKGKMTALELIRVITALSELASDMTIHLAKACGLCNNCGDENPEAGTECGCGNNPAEWVANCSLCHDLLDESQSIHIPDYLLEEADIPEGAKLEAYTDGDSGEITVVEADIQQDINDVPPCILSMLAQSGICLAALDELIMQESIIYGK